MWASMTVSQSIYFQYVASKIEKEFMNKPLLILFLLALAAYGQQQERVAIINTVDDLDSISFTDLNHLTNKLRETAVKILPKSRYGVMTTESIVAFLGDSQERAAKICNEASCLAEIGRKVNADYVAQAHIGRFGGELSINFELYNSKSGNLIDQFTGSHQKIFGLLAIIDENAPILFKKLPGASSTATSPIITGGISGLEKASDYELIGEKRYLANITSNPEGANLSFNGIPDAHCTKTPCNVELKEGNVRIIANLEQYEIADTTVSIKQNKQNINIRLKANFGVLEIKPAYIDGIGNDMQWNLSINDKPYSLGEIRLSPKEYTVKLNHECYEDISFKAGINKDKREIFDMANNIVLKKGGLNLSAEADGEPVSESVYVNGRRVGETPFSGTIPMCAKIEIGTGREAVNVKIKHNAAKTYTHKMDTEKMRLKQEEKRKAELKEEREAEKREAMRTSWMIGFGGMLSGGVSFNMNEIDSNFKSLGLHWNPISLEFYKRNFKFFRFGFNFDWGSINVLNDSVSSSHFKVHTFVRLYPVDFLFLSGGAGLDIFKVSSKDVDVTNISTPVFPIGGGICLCTSASNDFGGGIAVEWLYNIAPFKGRTAKYMSINVGIKIHGRKDKMWM